MTRFVKPLLLALAALAAAPAAAAQTSAPATPAASPGVFRIAVEGAASPCSPTGGDAGAEALRRHVETRLQRPVQVCGFATRADAARALSSGEVEFARLDGAAYAGSRETVRALLAPRATRVGRILTVAVVRAGSDIASLAAAGGRRIVYAGDAEAFLEGPRSAAVDHGLAPPSADLERRVQGAEAALAALRAGEADLMLLHASAWQRVCRGERAGESVCDDLSEIWRGRARAPEAWAVRRDLDRETMLRLVGIMVALHLENRAAFDWMAPGARELGPTEADALLAGG